MGDQQAGGTTRGGAHFPAGGHVSATRICVAIVSWNTRDLLERCVRSLASALAQGWIEVVVVDNGSGDGSADCIERGFPGVRVLRNRDNLGFTRATNQAAAQARAPYLLMLNSDTEVSEQALRDCADLLDRRPEVAGLGCRLVYPDGRAQSSCFRFPSLAGVALNAGYLAQLFPRSTFWNRDRYGAASWSEERPVDCVMGSFLMLRRAALGDGAPLDEGYFMYGEEADLCFRLKQQGHQVLFTPAATVVHHHSGSSAGDPRTAARVYLAKQRGILRFLRKWRGLPAAYLANLVMLLGLLPRLAGWALADAAAALRARRRPRPGELLKAGGLRFHLAALAAPSRFESSWAWTHEADPADRIGS